MTDARLNYVELPVGDAGASAHFFEAAFGWSLTAFGPTYAATTTGDVDVGLQGEAAEATAAPLPVIHVGDLDAVHAAVVAASGVITRAPFDFPGGRRFHFREPGGCELAAWTQSPH
ncbi:MAG: VOC family protein [Sphingomonadaceae bacterium]|nr:VOC family protein [Sphingomonadaceae bacterium]